MLMLGSEHNEPTKIVQIVQLRFRRNQFIQENPRALARRDGTMPDFTDHFWHEKLQLVLIYMCFSRFYTLGDLF